MQGSDLAGRHFEDAHAALVLGWWICPSCRGGRPDCLRWHVVRSCICCQCCPIPTPGVCNCSKAPTKERAGRPGAPSCVRNTSGGQVATGNLYPEALTEGVDPNAIVRRRGLYVLRDFEDLEAGVGDGSGGPGRGWRGPAEHAAFAWQASAAAVRSREGSLWVLGLTLPCRCVYLFPSRPAPPRTAGLRPRAPPLGPA